MIKVKTVRVGERVAVWNKNGKMRVVDGPSRLFLMGETFESLKRFSAAPNEYLAITFRDGKKEHVKGPVSMWMDPVIHASIVSAPAITIEAHEAIVVYAQESKGVIRKIVKGPELYVPSENEWIRDFRWHGADSKNPDKKVPRGLQFQKLRTIPDQMYFDVTDVRTSDDALLVIKLMVFFELKNVETMLDETHDPVADFINALSADVIDFVASNTFESFKEKTEKLNDISIYEMLVQRAQKIGYQINKVVYRGYHATSALQDMHNKAIETRTFLKLESETEKQAQLLADYKQEKAAERAKAIRKMEEETALHQNRLAKLAHEEKIRQKVLEFESDRKHQESVYKMDTEFFQTVKTLDVDMTKYLVSKSQSVEKVIKFDGLSESQLHVHES